MTSLRLGGSLGVRLGVILACGLMASGCAVSGGMGNLFAKGKASDAPMQGSVQGNVHASALANEEATGSTNAPTLRASAAVVTSGLPSETDLVFARTAIVEVLKRGSKEVSAPWENPGSGARGTVTPIANAYARDGATCHDFLASYIRRGSPESWMQGQACRAGKRDAWEVRSLRPWTRS